MPADAYHNLTEFYTICHWKVLNISSNSGRWAKHVGVALFQGLGSLNFQHSILQAHPAVFRKAAQAPHVIQRMASAEICPTIPLSQWSADYSWTSFDGNKQDSFTVPKQWTATVQSNYSGDTGLPDHANYSLPGALPVQNLMGILISGEIPMSIIDRWR